MPLAMERLIGITQSFAEGWPVLLPLLAVLFALFLVALLYYVGFSPRNLPVVGRLWRRVDCALILRWMAVAVRQKRPMADFMRLLAGYFPQAALRTKLERSARRIGNGVHWCDALQRAGVIRGTECSILKSAERAGNLAWALDEMADSTLRRSAYRMRTFVSAAFPIVLLVFAACILAIAAGIFLPLLSLMSGIA
jgi:type II secretory pathway component PulF